MLAWFFFLLAWDGGIVFYPSSCCREIVVAWYRMYHWWWHGSLPFSSRRWCRLSSVPLELQPATFRSFLSRYLGTKIGTGPPGCRRMAVHSGKAVPIVHARLEENAGRGLQRGGGEGSSVRTVRCLHISSTVVEVLAGWWEEPSFQLTGNIYFAKPPPASGLLAHVFAPSAFVRVRCR